MFDACSRSAELGVNNFQVPTDPPEQVPGYGKGAAGKKFSEIRCIGFWVMPTVSKFMFARTVACGCKGELVETRESMRSLAEGATRKCDRSRRELQSRGQSRKRTFQTIAGRSRKPRGRGGPASRDREVLGIDLSRNFGYGTCWGNRVWNISVVGPSRQCFSLERGVAALARAGPNLETWSRNLRPTVLDLCKEVAGHEPWKPPEFRTQAVGAHGSPG